MTIKPRRFIYSLAAAFVMAAAAAVAMPPAQQAPQRWEQIESVEAEMTDDVAVVVRENTVFVTVGRPTTVKLFTILGQPISQATLQPGTSRFRVGARGIYILKIGSITRRITI